MSCDASASAVSGNLTRPFMESQKHGANCDVFLDSQNFASRGITCSTWRTQCVYYLTFQLDLVVSPLVGLRLICKEANDSGAADIYVNEDRSGGAIQSKNTENNELIPLAEIEEDLCSSPRSPYVCNQSLFLLNKRADCEDAPLCAASLESKLLMNVYGVEDFGSIAVSRLSVILKGKNFTSNLKKEFQRNPCLLRGS